MLAAAAMKSLTTLARATASAAALASLAARAAALESLAARAAALASLATLLAAPLAAASLEDDLGRNESRVYSAPFAIPAGRTVQELALPERLARLAYRRVAGKPQAPGEYFHGDEVFWIYRHACHARGSDRKAELFGLALDKRSHRVTGWLAAGERNSYAVPRPIRHEDDAWLEPALLAESLKGERADRVRYALAALPDRVWQAILAAEDHRFFEHGAIDPRSVARAAWSNLRRGRVAEGGSTITQQLVKNRDLPPKRSLGRKASEALRALALEADYDKREILAAYVNSVYLGNVDGLAVHGIGAAARVYFSKAATDLTLAECATLAAMIQGPNRLSPYGDAAALRARRDSVLSQMAELGWASAAEAKRAQALPLGARGTPPRSSAPRAFLSWVAQHVAEEGAWRSRHGWGFLVETTLDPWLQRLAEDAVRTELVRLRRNRSAASRQQVNAALISIDVETGAVLAYVGGDPSDTSAFDRVRAAKRQPGSVVKPLVALEALDGCGRREPLTASSRIDDAPLVLDLPDGRWSPENFDHRFLGPVLLRDALVESRNVPAVRIARWCGFDATAERFRRAGLALPANAPPSFVLGAIETSPLAVARAYTVFAAGGYALEPYSVRRIETSAGRGVDRTRPSGRRAASASAAYIVRDLLRTAVERGTANPGEIAGLDVAAKTGSTSDLRDAWFAGQAGSVVTVVWVGMDDGSRLGLTGAQAAAPLWHDFMVRAVPARPAYEVARPDDVVEQWVEISTGLLVREGRDGARPELYRRGTLPSRRHWWSFDRAEPVIE